MHRAAEVFGKTTGGLKEAQKGGGAKSLQQVLHRSRRQGLTLKWNVGQGELAHSFAQILHEGWYLVAWNENLCTEALPGSQKPCSCHLRVAEMGYVGKNPLPLLSLPPFLFPSHNLGVYLVSFLEIWDTPEVYSFKPHKPLEGSVIAKQETDFLWLGVERAHLHPLPQEVSLRFSW